MNELENIFWVHRPNELKYEIDEADDLCRACCQKRVQAYREKFPEHAQDICMDGGWKCRESDNLAECDECGAYLSCYLLDAWINPAAWTEEERIISTEAAWLKAEQKMCDSAAEGDRER